MPVNFEPPPPPPPPPTTIPLRLRPPVGDESSWATLVRIVREEDEDRVRKSEGKIRACLLFSGLFSIMLSIFLVDSLHNLRPNYGAATVELLGQISAQQGFLLSSLPAEVPIIPASPTIQVPRMATYVTTLLTASLGISVVSASLALLLKQWLHDYITPSGSSPQADLRIRHSRQSNWGLLDLAALLPFMSQISMALFFAALCLLTIPANHVAGYTALSIAAGWVGMFALLVVAPVVFPQCPYKLPMPLSLKAWIESCVHEFSEQDSILLRRSIKAYGTFTLEDGVVREQGDAAKCDEAELDMLVAIYAGRREDHVLNVMWDALKERGATPDTLLCFVRKVICIAYPPSHRHIPDDKRATIPVAVMDLRSIPNPTYSTILDNIADLLLEEMQRQTGLNDTKALEWSSWMREALLFIFAESPHPIPAGTNLMFTRLMNADRADAFVDVVVSTLAGGSTSMEVTANNFVYTFSRMQGALKSAETQNCLACLSALIRRCFCTHDVFTSSHGRDLLLTLNEHMSSISPACLHSVGLMLVERLTNNIYPEMFWFNYLVDIMEALLYIDDHLSPSSPENSTLHEKLVKLARLMLHQSKNTAIFFRFAVGIAQKDEIQIRAASRLFVDAIVTAPAALRYEILTNISDTVDWQQVKHTEEMDNSWDAHIRAHVTKLYLLILKSVEELKNRGLLPETDSESDKSFRKALSIIDEGVAFGIRRSLGTISSPSLPLSSALDGPVEPTSSGPAQEVSGEGLTTGDDVVKHRQSKDDEPQSEGAPVDTELGVTIKPPSRQTDHDDDHTKSAKVPSSDDIDLAKQCLSLVASLDSGTVAADADDEDFTKWAKAFNDESSLFSDNVIKALREVLPKEESITSARLRRIELLKTQEVETTDKGVTEEKTTEKSKTADEE